jgi:tetratricopeptide (TPR) repeat protein
VEGAPAMRATASRIQVRIAYCLKSLGRIEESRRALQYAIDLNPDNLTARMELDRL